MRPRKVVIAAIVLLANRDFARAQTTGIIFGVEGPRQGHVELDWSSTVPGDGRGALGEIGDYFELPAGDHRLHIYAGYDIPLQVTFRLARGGMQILSSQPAYHPACGSYAVSRWRAIAVQTSAGVPIIRLQHPVVVQLPNEIPCPPPPPPPPPICCWTASSWIVNVTASPVNGSISLDKKPITSTPKPISIPYQVGNSGQVKVQGKWLLVTRKKMVGCRWLVRDIVTKQPPHLHCKLKVIKPRRAHR